MVLVCEVEHVVDRVFPGPAPAGGSALADTVGIQERVVGKLVHHRIVAVSARTHPIIELALPGEAFDGLHTEVSGQGKAVAVAVVVTAAGIGHRSNRIAGIGIQRPDTAVAQPVILGVRTVRLVDGHKRVRGQHIVHVVPVVVAGTDTATLVRVESHVLTEGDNIQAVLSPKHMVGVQADGETLVVGSDGLTENTFLMRIADTHRELRTVGTTNDIDCVVRVRRIDVTDGIQPVGPLEGAGLDVIVQRRIQDAGPVDGILAHVEGDLVLDVHILLGVQEFGHPLDILDSVEAIISDDILVALTLLGRDEDDTVRTTRTVDSAGSRVLEDVNALDVGRVE